MWIREEKGSRKVPNPTEIKVREIRCTIKRFNGGKLPGRDWKYRNAESNEEHCLQIERHRDRGL